jgi:hypothetical protein
MSPLQNIYLKIQSKNFRSAQPISLSDELYQLYLKAKTRKMVFEKNNHESQPNLVLERQYKA